MRNTGASWEPKIISSIGPSEALGPKVYAPDKEIYPAIDEEERKKFRNLQDQIKELPEERR